MLNRLQIVKMNFKIKNFVFWKWRQNYKINHFWSYSENLFFTILIRLLLCILVYRRHYNHTNYLNVGFASNGFFHWPFTWVKSAMSWSLSRIFVTHSQISQTVASFDCKVQNKKYLFTFVRNRCRPVRRAIKSVLMSRIADQKQKFLNTGFSYVKSSINARLIL